MASSSNRMNLDLLNQHTPSKSSDENQSVLTNMYLEEDQSTSGVKGEYKVVAYPMFGTTVFSTINEGAGAVRAMYEQDGVLYVVAGNRFCSVSSTGVATQIGTNLNTSAGFAKIRAITGGSDTNNQLIIIDGTNGYHYNIGTGIATFPIADPDFPQTATDLTSQDDYFMVEKAGSISYYLSNISDGLAWQALDFASKFRKPDRLVAINSNKGELWLLGSKSIEVWSNVGNIGFPFERRSDVFIEVGCAARSSVVVAGDTMFFLAKSASGGYSIAAIESYLAKVISTKAIMFQLSQMPRVDDCNAYAYAKDGHEFIDFTFPTAKVTLTLDITTGAWLNKQTQIAVDNTQYLGTCSAFCYGKSLIGDSQSMRVLQQNSDTYQDITTPMKRQFVSPPVYQDGLRIYINRLQIDVQTSVGVGTFLLEMSTDRGQTWETVDTYTVPTEGDGTIYTSSLGSAFCFLFRITTTDNFKFILLGFKANLTLGSH